MTGYQDNFAKLNEDNQIWDVPQFTVPDVCAITGTTPKAIEHFVNPKRALVCLLGDHANPGKGKRRIFSGGQVLMIAAAYTMNRLGFPQKFSMTMAEHVMHRASLRTGDLAQESGMTMLTYPMADGDWAVSPIYNETKETPELPVAVQRLDVDRLIDQVHAQLSAIVAGEDIPDFTIPDVAPDDPYSPRSNLMKLWERDESGEWKYVGLTLEETRDLMTDEGIKLSGDDVEHVQAQRNPDKEYIRVLRQRRGVARLQVCGLSQHDEDAEDA